MNIVFLALIQKHVKYALQFYYCNNQYVSRIDGGFRLTGYSFYVHYIFIR